MSPTVAVVGKPPTVTGLGTLVASNRGMILMFSERQTALDWLNVQTLSRGERFASRGTSMNPGLGSTHVLS
jgi:hypothetical protein